MNKKMKNKIMGFIAEIEGNEDLFTEIKKTTLLVDFSPESFYEKMLSVETSDRGVKLTQVYGGNYVLHKTPRHYAEAYSKESNIVKSIENTLYGLLDKEYEFSWQPYVSIDGIIFEINKETVNYLFYLKQKMKVLSN